MKQKIYTFALVSQGEGKPGELEFENLFTTRSDDEAEDIRRQMLERHVGFKRVNQTRNSREIVVIHVDRAEADKWQHIPGRNGLTAKPVKQGQRFRSGTEASGHIGLRHNEVSMVLSRCQATGEKQATVRGVTFAYANDAASGGLK